MKYRHLDQLYNEIWACSISFIIFSDSRRLFSVS